jgi:hypothetical protein
MFVCHVIVLCAFLITFTANVASDKWFDAMGWFCAATWIFLFITFNCSTDDRVDEMRQKAIEAGKASYNSKAEFVWSDNVMSDIVGELNKKYYD